MAVLDNPKQTFGMTTPNVKPTGLGIPILPNGHWGDDLPHRFLILAHNLESGQFGAAAGGGAERRLLEVGDISLFEKIKVGESKKVGKISKVGV